MCQMFPPPLLAWLFCRAFFVTSTLSRSSSPASWLLTRSNNCEADRLTAIFNRLSTGQLNLVLVLYMSGRLA